MEPDNLPGGSTFHKPSTARCKNPNINTQNHGRFSRSQIRFPPLTSNLMVTASLNPTNMWSSRPSSPAYRRSKALLTEYPHFPFTLNVISAPRSESDICPALGLVYRRCGMQPPYWHPQTQMSGSYIIVWGECEARLR